METKLRTESGREIDILEMPERFVIVDESPELKRILARVGVSETLYADASENLYLRGKNGYRLCKMNRDRIYQGNRGLIRLRAQEIRDFLGIN